MIYANISTQ